MSVPNGVPGNTILVVDDERVARSLLYRSLTEEGYRVFEAASAREAMAVLEQAHRYVALVMLDVVMPMVDGVELGRRMLARWPSLRLLFMSAYSSEILRHHGLDDPPLVFLHKPFTHQELMEKLVLAAEIPASRPGGDFGSERRRKREAGRGRAAS